MNDKNSQLQVLILYRFLPQYRIEFYNQLRNKLAEDSITLNLVYGKHAHQDALKNDEIELDWAYFRSNKIIKLFGLEIVWQSCWDMIKSHDLIIVEQANRLLVNYLLMVLRHFSNKKLAFWGHGLNLQIKKRSLRNCFKRRCLSQCDWWFAYTKSVKNLIMKNSIFPSEKITVVQNAIDTESLVQAYTKVKPDELRSLRNKLSLGNGPVGLFCGRMYRERHLDFLIAACDRIRVKLPDFQMLFIGSGPDTYKVQEATKTRNWVHYIGICFGLERIKYFKMADVLLMPGIVGLVILDSFALQTPMITTDNAFHGPEIEYLEDKKNGLMVQNDLDTYTSSVVELLLDEMKLDKLKSNCRAAAKKYKLSQMVDNFTMGIKCLLQE